MTDYYKINGKDYFHRTVSIDSGGFLTPLIGFLAFGASVLDLGCGSGRDLLWLKNQGFRPTGLERSETLARLAANHSGCEVICKDFETFDFSGNSYDALLSAGSFVHIPHDRLFEIMDRVKAALRPGGVFYISVKAGAGGVADDSGRRFYFWRDPGIRLIFDRLDLDVVFFENSPSALTAGDFWLAYVLKARSGSGRETDAVAE